MFPMISTVDEFLRARRLIEAVHGEEKVTLAYPLLIGAMIEVPAAALIAGRLAFEADFFSLGTNDLVQYTLACDRGNPRIANICRFQHPAVLRLVEMVVQAAHAMGRTAGVCGEAAGDADAMPLLVGLGVDDLSVGAARLPAVRRLLPTLDYHRLQGLATEACMLGTAEEVARLLDRAVGSE
jgi:phosphoenolpyruvate-protein kinase (PTS system EI component)